MYSATVTCSILAPELNGKRQEILMDAVPNVRRMAVLAELTSTPAGALQILQNAARARGVELMVFTAGARDEIAPAIDNAKTSGAGALNVLTAPLFFLQSAYHHRASRGATIASNI